VDAYKGPNNHIEPFLKRSGEKIITISGICNKHFFSHHNDRAAMAEEGLLLFPWWLSPQSKDMVRLIVE
jgi:hypothetical protein